MPPGPGWDRATSRRNSPGCGVRIRGPACVPRSTWPAASAFRASASMTIGCGRERYIQATSSTTSAARPKPGPQARQSAGKPRDLLAGRRGQAIGGHRSTAATSCNTVAARPPDPRSGRRSRRSPVRLHCAARPSRPGKSRRTSRGNRPPVRLGRSRPCGCRRHGAAVGAGQGRRSR